MVKKVGRFTFNEKGEVDEKETAADNFLQAFAQKAEEDLIGKITGEQDSPATAFMKDNDGDVIDGAVINETIPGYLAGIHQDVALQAGKVALDGGDFEGDTLTIIGMHGDFEGDTIVGHWSLVKRPVKVKKGPGKGKPRYRLFIIASTLGGTTYGHRVSINSGKSSRHGKRH